MSDLIECDDCHDFISWNYPTAAEHGMCAACYDEAYLQSEADNVNDERKGSSVEERQLDGRNEI